MKSLRANVTLDPHSERRATRRWQVDLLVSLPADSGGRHARVRNLSENGMMLESDAELAVGDILTVEVEGSINTDAVIVWRREQTFGCRFENPVPTSAVSAVILQAPADLPKGSGTEPRFEEIPVGMRPTIDELADWKARFEERHGADGMRLVGFRQTDGGLLIAIVSAD